jgi:hypothetical protein
MDGMRAAEMGRVPTTGAAHPARFLSPSHRRSNVASNWLDSIVSEADQPCPPKSAAAGVAFLPSVFDRPAIIGHVPKGYITYPRYLVSTCLHGMRDLFHDEHLTLSKHQVYLEGRGGGQRDGAERLISQ